MSPAFARSYAADLALIDAVPRRYREMGIGRCANVPHRFIRKLGVPVPVATGHSSFARSIANIIGARAFKEVIRVNTATIIALVADNKRRLREAAMGQKIRDTMGAFWLPVFPYHSVSVAINGFLPLPTSRWPNHISCVETRRERHGIGFMVVKIASSPRFVIVSPTQKPRDALVATDTAFLGHGYSPMVDESQYMPFR